MEFGSFHVSHELGSGHPKQVKRGTSMDIYSKPGTKVRYLDENGYDHQPVDAREAGLVKGQLYEVDRIEVGGWSSEVFLKGFKHGFNTVMFENVKE